MTTDATAVTIELMALQACLARLQAAGIDVHAARLYDNGRRGVMIVLDDVDIEDGGFVASVEKL